MQSSTALHRAAWSGRTAVIDLLVSKGANVNATKPNLDTPLHLASFVGHADVVRSLLAARANVNAKKTNGDTPLCVAAGKARKDCVKALIDAGADINACSNVRSLVSRRAHVHVLTCLYPLQTGDTALHNVVCSNGTDAEEVCRMLIGAGINVNKQKNSGDSAMHLAAWYVREAQWLCVMW